MSSISVPMIRKWRATALALCLVVPQSLLAADETERTDGSIAIDILARPKSDEEVDPRLIEECERQEDAAQISREIVVCREIRVRTDQSYSGSRAAARDRYAEETAFAGDLVPPDVSGPGIFKGEPSIGGLCIPGLQNCPPPPALIVDVTALPQAPPGSDADRIARGLPPLGNDEGVANEAQLGLPPPAQAGSEARASPAGSAAPKAER